MIETRGTSSEGRKIVKVQTNKQTNKQTGPECPIDAEEWFLKVLMLNQGKKFARAASSRVAFPIEND